MSKIYSFGYTKDSGDHNKYFVLEKENNRDYFKGLDLLDNSQFKTFMADHFDNFRCILSVDDSQLDNYQVLSLDDLCQLAGFNKNHVNLVGTNAFLNVVSGSLAKHQKVLCLNQNYFLLYGSEVRQMSICNNNLKTIILNIGPNGTPLTASRDGVVLTNDELWKWSK